MMAEYYTSITFTGNKEERQTFAEILKLYMTREHSGAYFHFRAGEIETIKNSDSETVSINEAGGPWGSYDELNDVDIFREIADAAPDAEMYAHIEGSGTYDDQDLKVKLKDKKLYILTHFYSYEMEHEYYKDEFQEKLPYEKFIELFKIDSDEFDEGAYSDFIDDWCMNEDQTITDISYEDFVAEVRGTSIGKEEYKEAIEELRALNIMTVLEYRENDIVGVTERYIYDPITRDYCAGNPSPSGVIDITEILEEQMDDDERDVSDISVEEAYDLFYESFEFEEEDPAVIELFNELFSE